MNTTYVNVEDSPYIITNIVSINIMKVDLFKSVTIIASLYNGNKLLTNKTFVLTGAEYDAWSNNDQYIIDITLEKLGLKETSGVIVTY